MASPTGLAGLGSIFNSLGSPASSSSSPSASSYPSSTPEGTLPFQGSSFQGSPQGVDGLPTQTPAATQLLSLTSEINALLQSLASTFPITSPYVESVVETLAEGVVEAISAMDTIPSVIGQPQIV